MDIGVKVNRTLDVGICLDVLTNPEIFDAISEDDATIENLKVDVINDYWLEVLVDGGVIGVVQFKQIFNQCWDAHIHILPNKRTHSMEAGKHIWEWVEINLTGCLIYTNIPDFCTNVVKFLKQFEFKESGKLEKAWRKNGIQNDMIILTRLV